MIVVLLIQYREREGPKQQKQQRQPNRHKDAALHCTRALSNITLCKMVNELYLFFPLSLLLHNAHSLAFLLLVVSFFSYYSFAAAAAASFAIQR